VTRLTRAQRRVLGLLAATTPMPLGDIAEQARTTPPRAVVTLNALVRMRLVSRAVTNGGGFYSLTLGGEALAEDRCRECGCTSENCRRCIERKGEPCHWVEPTLCSACVP